VGKINGDDITQAEEAFDGFADSLSALVDFEKHLAPIAMRMSFPAIVAARDETFMTVDSASDATVRRAYARIREDKKTTDIRAYTHWNMDGKNYSRESLNVYWMIDHGTGDERRIHTILRWLVEDEAHPTPRARVYVSAHISEGDLAHVVGRIRRFAQSAS